MAGPDKHAVRCLRPTPRTPRARSGCSAAATIVQAVSIMSSMSTQCGPSTSPMTSLASTVFFGHALDACARWRGRRQLVGVALGDLDPAGVGRHDDEVLGQVLLAIQFDQHRHGREVVDRAVEEALDLAGVEVDRDDALGPGGLEHVGDELGGDRLPTLGLAVLTPVSVEGATTVMRFADARLAASTMISCSMIASLIGESSDAAWPWKMNTSAAADRLAEPAVQLPVGELGERHAAAARRRDARRSPPQARDSPVPARA